MIKHDITINSHVYSIGAIYSMFQSCNIILTYKFHRFIDFKTLNAQYSKTTCLIELKLTGSIEGSIETCILICK